MLKQIMDDHQGSPPDNKRMSLEKIFEAMTADLENTSGNYVQFRISNQQSQSCSWTDCSLSHVQYMSNLSTHSNLSNIPSINQRPLPFYDKDLQQYNSSTAECICFPPQNMNHLGVHANDDVIRTIDIGGGNFINVIYGNATQFMAQQCQLSNSSSYSNNSNTDEEYELFNNQQIQVPLSSDASLTQHSNRKQVIDNFIGNWMPNQSRTYSQFGGLSNFTAVQHSISNFNEFEELQKNSIETQQRKLRTVTEVKPMRPSYSDVLTKSIPTPSFLTIAASKPIQEKSIKKVVAKNSKNKCKSVVLKRQNSSGNDEHGSPKLQLPKKPFEKHNFNLSKHWVSLDHISSLSESPELTLNSSNNFEKKKSLKYFKRTDKEETLNNSNIQNNSIKNVTNLQSRRIQINNNLNFISSFSQTVATGNKFEKNKQTNNKVKDEKKNSKERSFKHFQAEKVQQMKKNQRNRKKENKDTAFKDVFRTVHKYFNRWSKLVLKIFFWLLHLISDVFSMSANLVVQLGKGSWYYITIYVKYSWLNVLSKISKIHFLNTFGKWIDIWFGTSRFAFWKRLKTKNDVDESANCTGGLEANIALPSTGEEAMKRLLACKGKNPYSILGVTPTCTDDDIKKYYKRQAFLVHPDKNSQAGAEEAFKILVHAFDIIGEPERRQAFDETRQVEAAWSELNDLISQLHRKMEEAANTIRCTNCGLRHKRIPTQRPCYAARFCIQCKIRHSVKEGDIWAESRVMGFLWHYYACMEGAVYDVTDWAACQADNLKHLKANTHTIQYRIVLDQRLPTTHSNSNNNKRSADSNASSKTEIEDFLNKFYNDNKTGSSNCATYSNSMKGDNQRRKSKRRK